ncbi:hypothetical protein JQ609_00995 [Bradyrhizobium sp. AUGA SZCCT0169]|uniref:hypothetical protein n=1 Tax=Bradyrhizobium sp. AUGA SZCCT0169 TaxID=2807663 RepID=UPI001BA7A34B|nr:hypothetical protein [Bradyrhizobium sp. AUGA SZCCT0169]MBR1245500.1 hypothetical protein [Bradyrhizobium sp. AUGA SZCCT0169]
MEPPPTSVREVYAAAIGSAHRASLAFARQIDPTGKSIRFIGNHRSAPRVRPGGSDDLAVMLDSEARAGVAEMNAAMMASRIDVERMSGIPSLAPISTV